MSALTDFLKHHTKDCKIHVYSGDQHCSCGRDKAWEEMRTLYDKVGIIPKSEWSLCATHKQGYWTMDGCPKCIADNTTHQDSLFDLQASRLESD